MHFNQIFMNTLKIIKMHTIRTTEKSFKYPYTQVFSMLSTIKSFDILPQHSGVHLFSNAVQFNVDTFLLHEPTKKIFFYCNEDSSQIYLDV